MVLIPDTRMSTLLTPTTGAGAPPPKPDTRMSTLLTPTEGAGRKGSGRVQKPIPADQTGMSSLQTPPEQVELDNAFIGAQQRVALMTQRYSEQEALRAQNLVNKGADPDVVNREYLARVNDYQQNLVNQENEKLRLMYERASGLRQVVPTSSLGLTSTGEPKVKQATTTPLSVTIGKAIEKTDWYKKKKEQGGFLITGEYGDRGKSVDWGKIGRGASEFNKWIFFSPAMATGTAAIAESQIDSAVYEVVGRTADGRKILKNKLTGEVKIEKKQVEVFSTGLAKTPPSYEGGVLGEYIVRIGGKRYYVTSEGKLIRIQEPVIETTKSVQSTPISTNVGVGTSTPEGLPSMVGGTGLKKIPVQSKPSSYMFELNMITPPTMKGVGAVSGLASVISPAETVTTSTKITPRSVTSLVTPSALVFGSASSFISGGGSGTGTGSKGGSKQSLAQPQPQISAQAISPILAQPQALVTRQALVQQQPLQLDFFKAKPIRLTPPVPSLKIPKQTQPLKAPQQMLSFKKQTPLFQAFLKRKGKDISLGTFGALKSAKTKLVKELKGTLGASGFITKGKSVVPYKELNLGYEFRPSKKQPFRVVQKRQYRLGTRAEVTEIMGAKRRKEKKIKWL